MNSSNSTPYTLGVTASWQRMPAVLCSRVSILNGTGGPVQFRKFGQQDSGTAIAGNTLESGVAVVYYVSASASEIEYKAEAEGGNLNICLDQ